MCLHHADTWSILHPLRGSMNIMRDDSAILQEEILYGSGDPPTPYSRLHVTGNCTTLCKQSVQSWCCIFFTEHLLLCLQLALYLQLRIHLTSHRLHFLDISINGVAMWPCVFSILLLGLWIRLRERLLCHCSIRLSRVPVCQTVPWLPSNSLCLCLCRCKVFP